MQQAEYPLKITTGKYEVISSGVVHMTDSEVKFELANLTIKYRFLTDSEGPRYKGEVSGEELIINLFNASNSLGEGKLDPVEIGTLNGKLLFATWYVNTIQNQVRQFSYTFMLAEA